MGQKINSIGAIVSQMKKEENCDTTILPLKINESRKINKILGQLNMCKGEIEGLTSKISVCSEKDTKIDWESLQSSVSSIRKLSYVGKSSLNTASTSLNNSGFSPKMFSPRMYSSDVHLNNALYMFSSSSVLSQLKGIEEKTMKRKLPSSTVTNMIEWSEPKRKCPALEESDSDSQEDPNSNVS